jgi:hypothetical protein
MTFILLLSPCFLLQKSKLKVSSFLATQLPLNISYLEVSSFLATQLPLNMNYLEPLV